MVVTLAGGSPLGAQTGELQDEPIDIEDVSVVDEPELVPIKVADDHVNFVSPEVLEMMRSGSDRLIGPGFDHTEDWFPNGYMPIGMAKSYTVRLVTSHPSYNTMASDVAAVVAEVNKIAGSSLVVGAPTSRTTANDGEILIAFSSSSPCGPLPSDLPFGTIGCGGYTYQYWSNEPQNTWNIADSGNVQIAPALAKAENAALRRDVVFHEFAHTLGLYHFDDKYHGAYQVMSAMMSGVYCDFYCDPTDKHPNHTRFENGDVGGIRSSAFYGFRNRVTAPYSIPGAPVTPLIEQGLEAVSLEWAEPPLYGKPATGYEIELKNVSSGGVLKKSVGGGTRSTTFTHLVGGKPYQARVRVKTDIGWSGFGPWSVALNTAALPAPTATPGLEAVSVKWSAPPLFGKPALGYEVELKNTSTGGVLTKAVGGNTKSATFTKLTGGKAYQARFRVATDVGWSGWGPWSSSVTTIKRCTASLSDVAETSPFCEDIKWLVAEGITTGYTDGTFKPTQSVSRQAMAAYLMRYADEVGDPCVGPIFSDVDQAHQFCVDIKWLVDNGIAAGFEDGTFRPTSPVSRQAMAAYLYRFTGSPDGTPPDCDGWYFWDLDSSDPFCGEVEWASDSGIVNGFDDGTFGPSLPVSRQAMAAYLHRHALAFP